MLAPYTTGAVSGSPRKPDMSEHPEHENPAPVSKSRWPAVLSAVAIAYPLLPLAALYAEWLLAWYVLGHPPRPHLDDPKYIAGSSWMHPFFGLAYIGITPMFLVCLGLNAHYAFTRQLRWQDLVPRVSAFVLLWVGALALLAWDPGRVLYWWFD
jgi:hypothetical protein